MFRLIRYIFSCIALCAAIWFSVTVPIGKRTLWQHVVAISRTDEAKELADGARDTARDVAKKVREELAQDGGAGPAKPASPAKQKAAD